MPRLSSVLGFVLFILGVGIFFYPTASEYAAAQRADQAIRSAMVASVEDDPSASDSGKRSKNDSAYQYLKAYNERVREGQGGAINDPWGMGSDKDELASVGLPEGIVGSISVPSAGIQLPLYLGSTEANMLLGATVTSGTSAPLGETDSNVLIAAHRGPTESLPMFRDIENIRVGDKVTIDTLWDTLTYRVTELRTIAPDNVDAVKIQPGKDMVTLLTCHPYGYNYQRYIVYCERVEGDAAGVAAAGGAGGARVTVLNPLQQALEPSSSPLLVAERWLRVVGMALIALVVVVAAVRVVRRVFAFVLNRARAIAQTRH